MDVALHGREHDRALAGGVGLLHHRLEVGDRGLHRLGRLEHEGQLHLTAAEQLADDLHAVEQHVVHDLERRHRRELLFEVGFQPVALAVDDAVLQALGDRPARAVFLLDRARLDVLEQRHELGERVVVLAPPVVDEIERGLALLLVDPVQRHDARRVHDRGVEPGLAALVQEDAVQHVPGGGLQSERHVRQPEHGVRAGKLGLDAPDGLDRLHRVAAEVVVAGRERERERVEDQVGRFQAVALDGDVVDAARDPQLPVGRARLPFLVDGQADDGGAVFAREPEHPIHPLALVLALLEVGGVEQRLAAVVLQARLEHGGFRRVEHERQRRLGREPAGDLVHVDRAVATDVVDAHVEHVRAFLHLVARHLDAGVPVGFEHRVAELPRTVRVRALTDRQVCELLLERHVRVDRRATRLELGGAQHGRAAVEPLDDRPQVLRRGTAATADDVEPELGCEPVVRVCERGRGEVVVGVAVDDRRQSRVRQRRQERARVLREVAEVLGHLGRAGRAVHADDVGSHRFERGERGADLGADEHATRRLDRDLHHDRDRRREPRAPHRRARTVDGRFCLEKVVDGLDEQHVDAAGDQPVDLEREVVAQCLVANLAQRREPRTRSDRADHEAGPAVGGVAGGDFAGDLRGALVHLERLVGESVLVEDEREGAESGGLDTVDAHREELVVHPGDEIGPGHDELLVAALQHLAAEIVRTEVLSLHPRTERPVEHEHAFVERVEERVHRAAADRRRDSSGIGHRSRLRGDCAGSLPVSAWTGS